MCDKIRIEINPRRIAVKNIQDYRKIYNTILDLLEESPLERATLINRVIASFPLTKSELADTATNGRKNVLRSMCGTVINEMHNRSIISRDKELRYHKNTEKPIAIRLEECEEEIFALLRKKPCTRLEIKESLVRIFGTDETATAKDDNKLFTYIGQILKHITAEGLVEFDGSVYKIASARSAEIKNRQEVLKLKADFLSKIHAKGGEFFEHYFMNLLQRYLIRCGKTVTESFVTGGSDDGGIDGIAKTVDALGFKETIMVQTKNRNSITNETDVRSFYGAVCAAQGSRGIYAITSDFHPSAKSFLDTIDNCVGVNGERVFTMAADTSYGIIRRDGVLTIDSEVFE